MKRLALLGLGVLAAGHGWAGTLSQGSKEFALEGWFDSTSLDGKAYHVTVLYGEYPEDNVEIAVVGSARGSEHTRGWAAGVRYEHNFAQYKVVPYWALEVLYAQVEIEPNEKELTPEELLLARDVEKDAAVVGGHGGLKWFLAENVAMAVAVIYEWATNEVYEGEDGELDDANAGVRLGMRFVF